MKKLISTFIFCLFNYISFSQEMVELTEGKPTLLNGIEFSYMITNERHESDYSRYEVTVTAENNSGCNLMYLKRKQNLNDVYEGEPAAIVRFNCLNATGKRLTSKGANLRAKQFFVPYEQPEKNTEGKTIYKTIQVEAGYIFRNGSEISNTMIVIVPKGEKPRFRAVLKAFSDLAE